MSGICGVVNFQNLMDGQKIKAMNNIVSYRGPEDEGYCIVNENGVLRFAGDETKRELIIEDIENLPNNSQNSFVHLGHRKLLLKGVNEKESQPVVDQLNQLSIVLDGQIYNQDEVKKKLVQLGVTSQINSDAELIIESYKKWGEKCVDHFNGIWSFALWDGMNQKLFCSRDRMGEKPFHYYYDGESFIFGSEIKQLLVLPTVQPIMNELVMATNLVYHIRDYDENTLVKGVKELRGGHNLCLTVDPKQKKITEMKKYLYWILDFTPYDKEPEEGYIKFVENEFVRSVKLRMADQANYGAMLSGGLDSSVLVAEMCKQLKEEGKDVSKFVTLSTKFDSKSGVDESNFAHLVNEFCGCDENLITPQIDNLKEEVEKSVWHVEADGAIATIHGAILAHMAKERGIDVLFNGQAGDETMFGYEKYYATYFLELLKHFHLIQFVKDYKAAAKNSRLNGKLLAKYMLYYNFPTVRNKRAKQLGGKYYTQKLLDQVNAAHLAKLVKVHNTQELQKNELLNIQFPFVTLMDDRCYMGEGIETRIPFADYQYVEKAVRIPAKYKIQQGYTKFLERSMKIGQLPDEVLWRTNKFGFPAPFAQWFLSADPAYIEELFHDPKSTKYFNVEALKEEFKQGKVGHEFIEFVNYETFMRLFNMRTDD